MSTPITFNGVSYSVPAYNDTGYAQGPGTLSSYLIAIASGTLQQSGGTFSLTADANFGTNFGLVALYYKSTTSNIATAGTIRLARIDTIDWRNVANSGNHALGVNASDQLTYDGSVIITGGGGGFVSSITGTANQIIASSPTGAVTLSTPQDIGLASSPTFASETLTNTTNQLVLGTTRTVTLNAPTPATVSRIITLPDLSAAYSVVGTEGTQTINGVKTFTGANAYGIPASITLTNGTGLPLTTGVTGTLPIANGGTNSSTTLSGSSIIVSNGSAIVQGTAGTTTTVLHGNAAGTPTYGAVSLTADVTGTLPVPNGGTGNTTFTAYSIIAAGTTATGAFQNVSGVGSSGQVLTSNGAATLPTWQNVAGSGTVNSGTANHLAYYATSTNAVSDMGTNFTFSAGTMQNSGVLNTTGASGVLSIQSTSLGLRYDNGGNSYTVIASPAATRTYTIINAGANADFVMSEGTATINGIKTLATQGIIHGTSTNDNAAAGFVGEYVSASATAVSATTAQYVNVASISLTAGDWDVTGQVVFRANGATFVTSSFSGAVSAFSGNTTTDQVDGDNELDTTVISTTIRSAATISAWRQSLSGTTTIYVKGISTFSAGTVQYDGRISARRVR